MIGRLIAAWFLFARLGLAVFMASTLDPAALVIAVTEFVAVYLGLLNAIRAKAWDTSLVGLICPAAYLVGMMIVPTAPAPTMLVALQLVLSVLAVVGKLNLAGSFSVGVPTYYQLVERGLYRFVRHPLFAVALAMRWCGLVAWPSAWNLAVCVVCTALCSVCVVLEERFLSRYTDYGAYRRRVRYRLVPCVW